MYLHFYCFSILTNCLSFFSFFFFLQFLDTFAEGPFHMLKADHLKNKNRILAVIACGGSVNNRDAWADLVELVKE